MCTKMSGVVLSGLPLASSLNGVEHCMQRAWGLSYKARAALERFCGICIVIPGFAAPALLQL